MKKRYIVGGVFVIVILCCVLIATQYRPDLSTEKIEAAFGASRDDFIEVQGSRVHFRDEGPRDAETVLLLHGMGSSLYAWQDLADMLADDHRVIRLDLPGHGLTGPVSELDCSPESVAAYVAQFTDALGVEQFHIAGSSWGGQIAAELALEVPSRALSLTLLDSSGLPAPPSSVSELSQSQLGRAILTNFTSHLIVRKSLKEAFHDDAKVTEELVEQVVLLHQREGNREAGLSCRDALDLSIKKGVTKFEEIETPTLILWGDQDLWIPLQNGIQLRELIPDSELISYPSVGHLPMEERPDLVNRDMREFWKRRAN